MSFFDIFKGKCELCKKCSEKIQKESDHFIFKLEDGTQKMWFFNTTKKGVMEDMVHHLQNQLTNCVNTCKNCSENFARKNEKTLMDIYNLNEVYLYERKTEYDEDEIRTIEDAEKAEREEWEEIKKERKAKEEAEREEWEEIEKERKAKEEAEEAARVYRKFADKEYQETIHRQQAVEKLENDRKKRLVAAIPSAPTTTPLSFQHEELYDDKVTAAHLENTIKPQHMTVAKLIVNYVEGIEQGLLDLENLNDESRLTVFEKAKVMEILRERKRHK